MLDELKAHLEEMLRGFRSGVAVYEDHLLEALAKLAADAKAAGVRLHVLVDARDGFLDGEIIRAAVADWRRASIWFCGPTGLGQALSRDFEAAGMDLDRRFHHELFAMR